MQRAKMSIDHEPGSDFVIHSEPEPKNVLDLEPVDEVAEPLTSEEIKSIRWTVFGKCPICGNYVKDWSPGAFNPERYKYWQDAGIDALTGHKLSCSEKWRRA
jgi:hypothetical protein